MPQPIKASLSLQRHSAKLARKPLIYSHTFHSTTASEANLTAIRRHISSYWSQSHGGVMMDNEIVPIEKGLIMNVVGIFPRENLINLHDDCARQWFRIVNKKTPDKFERKFDPTEGELPSYDAIPARSVIKKIGVELEGGWSYFVPPGTRGDGSVFNNGIPPVNIYGLRRTRLAAGEISFGPYTLKEIPWGDEPKFTPLPEATYDSFRSSSGGYWKHDFATLYPDLLDGTCGMHVHFSFPNPMIYSSFVDRRFQPWLLNGLERWGTRNDAPSAFFARLMGENRFCRKDVYEPTSQVIARTRTGVRYAAVNYCYTMHGTMEVRVLPMFGKVKQAQAAIVELIRLVNLWGDAKSPKPKAEDCLVETEHIN